MYSECIYTASSNPCFVNGFSIWRFRQCSWVIFCPSFSWLSPKERCYDLNYLLLWSSSRNYSLLRESASNQSVQNEYVNQQSSNQSASSSGWDVVRSISKATNCYMLTPNFERIWWDKGCDIRRPVSIWRPIPHCGYGILGDCITEGLEGYLFHICLPYFHTTAHHN